MNSTSLVRDEFKLLEITLARFGTIVTVDQFAQIYQGDRFYLRKRLSVICKKGWLFRVRRGLYIISDLASRGTLSISHYAVANLIMENSYISFESSLQFHGLYDQLLKRVTSVTTRQLKSTTIDGFTYHYVKTKPEYFYGWESQTIDGLSVKIAGREKALIDLIQFHRSRYTVDLVLEKLNDLHDIDLDLFTNLILKTNVVTQRVMGFMLDLVGLDSSHLHRAISKKRGTSRITAADDNLYSPKWSLYYDPYFSRYA
jgi:predicted transcriptional regulator of viral defense system